MKLLQPTNDPFQSKSKSGGEKTPRKNGLYLSFSIIFIFAFIIMWYKRSIAALESIMAINHRQLFISHQQDCKYNAVNAMEAHRLNRQ